MVLFVVCLNLSPHNANDTTRPNTCTCPSTALVDILHVHQMDEIDDVPLPRRPALVVITSWQCFYLAFSDETARQAFADVLNRQIESTASPGEYG